MRKMSDYVDTNPTTADTPNGTFKNETPPNACDGTDIKAEHMQDPYYALYQILQLAGEIPNGELENGTTNRQFLKSLASIGWFKYDSNIEYKKSAIIIHYQLSINITSVELFKDTDGSTSSRIVALFVVIVFDLIIIALSTILQKDIPDNASNILITIATYAYQ